MFNMANASLIMLFLYLGIVFIAQNTSAEEPKFGVELPLFDYVDTTKWGSQTTAWSLCTTGERQSPINLDTEVVLTHVNSSLDMTYNIDNVTLSTNGLFVQLVMKTTGSSKVTIHDKTYFLTSMRWQTPSEHTVNNVSQIAELQQQFVEADINVKGAKAMIIATIFEVGEPDQLIDALQPGMETLAKEMITGNESGDYTVEIFNFPTYLLQTEPAIKYMTYSGSLSTPPCTEDILWAITPKMTMTIEQVCQINGLQSKKNKNNARNVQPNNNREYWLNYIK